MNGDAEASVPRPRPLSGGLWSLLSWLRRDEQLSSSDSISSIGSDRTVASFAFLTPERYRGTRAPIVLPPPGPPTDSYKKRLHDRNLRHKHDSNLTLHRKYGLYRSEDSYNTFSLPSSKNAATTCADKWQRDRRATSECFQRRSVHVPGKRRAPLPPTRASSIGPTATFPRRSRKRPAPLPPANYKITRNETTIENNTHQQMNTTSECDSDQQKNKDSVLDCKSEKYSKKEPIAKQVKNRPEKSFLKQIFENKKRNSVIDTTNVKILPSISELDKQATELIIERDKLKNANLSQNQTFRKENASKPVQEESWICTVCLKKYNASVLNCRNCSSKVNRDKINALQDYKNSIPHASSICTQTEKGMSAELSKNPKDEERQKLKEMLKEMKDSLPKRSKNNENDLSGSKKPISSANYVDLGSITPTLPIGSKNAPPIIQAKHDNVLSKSTQETELKKENVIKIVTVIDNITTKSEIPNKENNLNANKAPLQIKADIKKVPHKKESSTSTTSNDIHTPLKISSLLNPVYIPKYNVASGPSYVSKSKIISSNDNNKNNVIEKQLPLAGTSIIKDDSAAAVPKPKENQSKETTSQVVSLLPIPQSKVVKPTFESKEHEVSPIKPSNTADLNRVNNSVPSSSKGDKNDFNIDKINHHIRRRELINQLEQSIAKGDEKSAADAAIKLAQLKLSCSVLSFSSQIASEPLAPPKMLEKKVDTKIVNTVMVKHTELSGNKNTKVNISMPSTSKGLTGVKADEIAKEIPKQRGSPILTESTTSSVANNVKDNKVQTTVTLNKNNIIAIQVWVEDKEATRGPINLNVGRQSTVRQLRLEAEATLGIPTHLQRWIVGRTLCNDNNAVLTSLAGPDLKAPFYLCLVKADAAVPSTSKAAEVDTSKSTNKVTELKGQTANVYRELMQLEKQSVIKNAEIFECGVCLEECAPGNGVVLRECVHTFCVQCLSDVIRHCEEPDVSCPAMTCRGILQEREIRALVSPEEYERWLARGLAAAESGTRNAFHCRTKDCGGWALCEPGVQRFPCPVCKHINCVPCKSIHEGVTCEQYRAQLEALSKDQNKTDESTQALLQNLINKGEALECPECKAIITKKWGCDWVKCSACKTEICWVTRGRRWGPAGRGDTSAGCRCGLDGQRCHPSCGYCH